MGKESINYEILYEFLRLEKTRDELQKIESDFYEKVIRFLKETESSLMEKDMDLMESRNIADIIKEVYKRRESKIIRMALDKSRYESHLVDTTILLKHEKELFDSLVSMLTQLRQKVLGPIVSLKKRATASKEVSNIPVGAKEIAKPKKQEIIITEAVEEFFDEETNIYGPYKNGDIALLPEKVAEILISKGMAKEKE